MPLKRVSGDGSTSRRFAKVIENGEEVKIPVTRDCATVLYLSENGEWPKTPILRINADVFWLTEGVEFPLENLAPGAMGKATIVKVREMAYSIQFVRTKGMSTLGQARRNVLLELSESSKEELMNRRIK